MITVPPRTGLRGARSKVATATARQPQRVKSRPEERRAVPERPGISGRPLPAWRHRRFESEYA